MYVEARRLKLSDYADLRKSMMAAYAGWDTYWDESHIKKLLSIFPAGQLAIAVDGKVVGCALSLILNYEDFGDDHNYKEITGNFTFSTHNPKGDYLYGIEVFITPEYRGHRLGRRLYDERKELCEALNLKGILFGGRIPGYHIYADKLTPIEYVAKVQSKELHDPTMDFQLFNDFYVRKILKEYITSDLESGGNAVLLQWDNIFYTEDSTTLYSHKVNVRLGLVQWQMRPYKTLEDLFRQVEFFVDAISSYKSDFAVFPEFFNAPLMSEYDELSENMAIRRLAESTDEIRRKFSEYAIKYNVNIITGSMPMMKEDGLYNVGFLCRRDGTYEEYEKLHVTPDESKFWGLVGGKSLKIFDTDCGKVGVLICYDVEFPELARILSDQGMQILFVPFLTDTQNAYSRVRNCAAARAIENECFVAIAGSVGNLPNVSNMDIQYAQSAVFTPCDYAFPSNGIKAESTPNSEMVLVVDVNLDLLTELHSLGSVRNLIDRRTDLYSLSWIK